MDSAFERVLMEGAQFMRRFAAMARTPRCSSDQWSTMTTSAPSSRAGEEGDDDEYGEGDGSNAPPFPRRKKAWQEWRVRGRDGRSAIAHTGVLFRRHVDEVRWFCHASPVKNGRGIPFPVLSRPCIF